MVTNPGTARDLTPGQPNWSKAAKLGCLGVLEAPRRLNVKDFCLMLAYCCSKILLLSLLLLFNSNNNNFSSLHFSNGGFDLSRVRRLPFRVVHNVENDPSVRCIASGELKNEHRARRKHGTIF